jgi:predicted DCC family thiol-disulfide oxidoreductase YuxK
MDSSDIDSSSMNTFLPVNIIKILDIVLITHPECHWCVKTINFCKESNILDLIRVIDYNSSEAQDLLKKYSVETAAIPTWISRITGRYRIGYSDNIDNIIKELKICM